VRRFATGVAPERGLPESHYTPRPDRRHRDRSCPRAGMRALQCPTRKGRIKGVLPKRHRRPERQRIVVFLLAEAGDSVVFLPMHCKRARSSFPRRCSCCDMAKHFECNGVGLAEWARQRVEDDDEDEDDEDALCWSLPTASCRLPTLVAAISKIIGLNWGLGNTPSRSDPVPCRSDADSRGGRTNGRTLRSDR